MTHSGGKPHNVGDKGQRYEVRATGYPKEGFESVIGWSDALSGAERMAAAIGKAPGCTSTAVVDRHENLCEDCPPDGYPTDKTRCLPCPRRATTDRLLRPVLRTATPKRRRLR